MQDNFFIKKTNDAKDLPLPMYMTKQSAGMDLYANVSSPIVLKKGEIKLVPTGIQISIPEGYEAQIRPRSGLSMKYGVTLVNTPGTVDADYRGEIKVILINHGDQDFTIQRADRIAQMVINKIEMVQFKVVDCLDMTERGVQGFGHTGVNV